MSEMNERSVASTGSVEPVAYQAVDEYGRPFGYAQIILPFGKWPKAQRVALYLQPQPTLTDAEREVIEWAVRAMRPECRAVLQGLLDRLSPIANCDCPDADNTPKQDTTQAQGSEQKLGRIAVN